MAKQIKKESEARSRIPDKDEYTAGGPRNRPRARPNAPHADKPPRRGESLRLPEVKHEESVMNSDK